VPEFFWLSGQARLDVAQALPERQLRKRHRPALIGAREALNPATATVARDDPPDAAVNRNVVTAEGEDEQPSIVLSQLSQLASIRGNFAARR